MPLMITSPQRRVIGRLHHHRLPAALAYTLAANHARVLDLFRALDTEDAGQITRKQLRKMMTELNLAVSSKELSETYDALDPDRRGIIYFRDLQQALYEATRGPTGEPRTGPQGTQGARGTQYAQGNGGHQQRSAPTRERGSRDDDDHHGYESGEDESTRGEVASLSAKVLELARASASWMTALESVRSEGRIREEALADELQGARAEVNELRAQATALREAQAELLRESHATAEAARANAVAMTERIDELASSHQQQAAEQVRAAP